MAKEFDVFLCHNGKDKLTVTNLAEGLQQRGIKVKWSPEFQSISSLEKLKKEIIETTKTVALLVGKDEQPPWTNPEIKAWLHFFFDKNLTIIPVLLPGVTHTPKLPEFLRQNYWINLKYGLSDDALSLLIWRITGLGFQLGDALEISKELVNDAVNSSKKNEKDFTTSQFVDIWGIASVKSRLHELSELVAKEAIDYANRASEIYQHDFLTQYVPLLVKLRWQRGYASALETLLTIATNKRYLEDFPDYEILSDDNTKEGVLSAQKENDQVVIFLDSDPVIKVNKLKPFEADMILHSFNTHGRLGVSSDDGLSLFQRINKDVQLSFSPTVSEELTTLYENKEVLIPLVARKKMLINNPFLRECLVDEENLQPVGDSFFNELLPGEGSTTQYIQEDDVEEETFVAEGTINIEQFSDQDIQNIEQFSDQDIQNDPEFIYNLLTQLGIIR